MYMGFDSDVLPRNKITDYLVRVVQPKLQAVPGVQTAEILGGQNFALRAWLDPAKLAAYGLTAADVSTALAQNDYISGLGTTKGQMVQVSLTASTSLHSRRANSPISSSSRRMAPSCACKTSPMSRSAPTTMNRRSRSTASKRSISASRSRRRQSARRHRRRAQGVPGHPGAAAARPAWRDHLRLDRIREQLDPRSDPHAGRSAGHRDAGRLRVPRLAALGVHPDRRHSAVAHRHVHVDAGVRLLDQSADAAGAGAGDRPGGRRRHHRRRKRQPPSRRGHAPDRGGDRRRRASSAGRSSP